MDNDLLKGLFIPTWNNKPPFRKPILSLNGIGILRFQNISCIIAQPGAGKSSVNESIISSIIDKNRDCLGFETTINRAMYIDFERAEEDVWTSFERIMKRSNTEKNQTLDNIQIISFRNVSTAKTRKERIEGLLQHYKPELLLLDGIGDLVDDTNSLAEAITCKNWIRHITSEFKVSILTTLHPNKNSNTPRGHIGSETLREAEGVLLIEVDANGTRTLTSDFAHGKARNGKHATTCFKWNDDEKMFMSVDVIHKIKLSKLPPEERLTHEELIQLVQTTHTTKLTANDTTSIIETYLKTHITYIKTSTSDIAKFIKYLESNNYLTVTKNGRNRYYDLHINYKK